jgi:hypothetical protein
MKSTIIAINSLSRIRPLVHHDHVTGGNVSMRKILIWAFFVTISVPAQASVHLHLDTILTASLFFPDPSLPPWEQEPEVFGPYSDRFHMTAESWDDPFNIDHIPMSSNCSIYFDGAPCVIPSRAGNVLSFQAPILGGAYQSLSINLTFNRDIEQDPTNISSENFVSGYFYWSYGHHNGGATVSGPVVSLAVPEPMTWATMVCGLALTGAAMRRRKVTVRFA